MLLHASCGHSAFRVLTACAPRQPTSACGPCRCSLWWHSCLFFLFPVLFSDFPTSVYGLSPFSLWAEGVERSFYFLFKLNKHCGSLFCYQQSNIYWLSYFWCFNVSFGCRLCWEIASLISNSVVVSILSGLERMLLFTDYLPIVWTQLKHEAVASRVAKCM